MATKKILIIGSKGMAGHMLYTYFKEKEDVVVEDVSRGDDYFASTYNLDVTDTDKLASIIAAGNYDGIINCIGILNQDAETNPDKAVIFNSYLPHFLARQAAANNSRLIHISTDCVFSGTTGGYKEDSFKDGKGFYAQSKALGEVAYTPHITIRTSIIGPELKDNGIGLLHWFLKQEGSVKGYTKAFWTGITTLELAKAVDYFLHQPAITSIVHAVPSVKVCKFDLLKYFSVTLGNNKITSIEPFDGYEVDKSLIHTRTDVQYQPPGYEAMLKELKTWMYDHSDLYRKYLDVMITH